MEVPTGSHIRRWRKSLGITQTKLSGMSGVAQSIIAKIENEVVDPRASTLRKVVEALARFENPDMLHTVQDIMTTDVAALRYEDTIQLAIDRMVKDGISQLPVLSEDGSIIGIISEDSLLQRGANRNGVVGQVMHTNPAVVDIGLSVAEARRRLTEVEALLVIEAGLLVGLVSRMDLVRALRLNSIA
ncbi:MAG TPA: CBS domain-containing protein [Candidatus Poseidoniaceae archaeon]|nr:MAG TPA: CBS domain-containing protein [Candidatus Poseidoniales archaeon]HII45391.1 CBS domain-containing protein [Candidatus Poseidoniaceae archaeon]|tara:strand:+ start:1670 stop:2230 length:561 start_codon:yes stop_codon:yes gene_type:complete